MIIASVTGTLLGWLISLLSLFLICLVLIQRGRGGGLTGALGGMGGQSAFGARAGDNVMWITAGIAFAWILLCAIAVWLLGNGGANNQIGGSLPDTVIEPAKNDKFPGGAITTPGSNLGAEGGLSIPAIPPTKTDAAITDSPATDSPTTDSPATESPPASEPAPPPTDGVSAEGVSAEGATKAE